MRTCLQHTILMPPNTAVHSRGGHCIGDAPASKMQQVRAHQTHAAGAHACSTKYTRHQTQLYIPEGVPEGLHNSRHKAGQHRAPPETRSCSPCTAYIGCSTRQHTPRQHSCPHSTPKASVNTQTQVTARTQAASPHRTVLPHLRGMHGVLLTCAELHSQHIAPATHAHNPRHDQPACLWQPGRCWGAQRPTQNTKHTRQARVTQVKPTRAGC